MYNETRRAAHCGAQQARDESRAADSEDLNVTKRKIGILGAGTWGMALARMLCVSGNDVLVWSAIEKEIDTLSSTRVHPNLPGMKIPEELRFTKSVEEVCRDKDILLFAVPSPFVRSTAKKAATYIPDGQLIVDVAKGVEDKTLMTMSEIIEDELAKAKRTARVVSRLEIIIHEGKNREVRKMCEAVGKKVIALHRAKIANIDVKNLKIGQWRFLTKEEIKTIVNQ